MQNIEFQKMIQQIEYEENVNFRLYNILSDFKKTLIEMENFKEVLKNKDSEIINLNKKLKELEKLNPQSESFLKQQIKDLEKKSEKDDLEISLLNEKSTELEKMNSEYVSSLKPKIKELEKKNY